MLPPTVTNMDALSTDKQHDSVLSPLMRAKKRATSGQKVNACPFGCELEDLDDNGYCRHLVGFTNDSQNMEVLLPPDNHGRRCVQVPYKEVKGGRTYSYCPVLKGDVLVKISISSRVYRDIDKIPAPTLAEPAKK